MLVQGKRNQAKRLLFGVYALFFSAIVSSTPIKLGTDEWCPYVCNPLTDDGHEGYLVDIAKAVFMKSGAEIQTFLLPFTRNVRLTRQGKLDGLIGVYRGDVPDFIFPPDHQGLGINTFYVNKNTHWTYTNILSLKKVETINLIASYDYGNNSFTKYINQNPHKFLALTGENTVERNIKLTINGRTTAFLEDNQVALYNINKLGFNKQIKTAGTLGNALKVYIAFSPKLPKKQADLYGKILTEGIEDLRASGELQTILENYNLKDWITNNDN